MLMYLSFFKTSHAVAVSEITPFPPPPYLGCAVDGTKLSSPSDTQLCHSKSIYVAAG